MNQTVDAPSECVECGVRDEVLNTLGRCQDCHRLMLALDFVVADDRAETDPCEAGTPGCCVDHTLSPKHVSCETW